MNNYDELKYTENDNADNSAIKIVNAPKVKTKEVKRAKITIFSIILSSVKNDSLKYVPMKERPYSVPVPKNTVWCLLAVLIILGIIFMMRSIVSLSIILPLTHFVAVFSFPLIIVMFFYEFNTRKNVDLFSVFSLFILGLFTSTLLRYFCDTIVIFYVYNTFIDTIIFPLLSVIISFLIIYIACKLFKLKNTPEVLLVSVAVFCGFIISNSIIAGFDSMFVRTELEFSKYPLYAIIQEDADLLNSFNQFCSHALYLYVFMPILYTGVAVVTASVISYNEQAKTVKKTLPKSSYLLLLLNFVILCMSALDLNITYFNVIAKVAALVIIMIISINMLNNCLNKEAQNVS